MVNEWTNTTLGDICSFASGSVFPQSEQGDAFGTYPFIKVSDMNLPGNERFITVANNWIDKKTQTRLRAKVHPAGATVFAKIGVALTYNRRRVLSQPTIIDNNMMTAIGDNARVHPLFFYYLLRTIDLNDVVAGTALPYLNISDLKRIAVTLPSLKEQRAIAHILSTLDDKIELNRRVNRTLGEMARAIFRSWFVNFDPVRAKMEGRWRKGESLPGLPVNLWDVFPDKLVDSELGKIPEGWEVGALGDIIEIHDSKRIPLSSRERAKRQGPYRYYGAAGIVDYVDDFLFDGIHVLVGEDGSVMTDVGNPVVQYVWGKFWVNNHAHVLKASSGISDEHLLLQLQQVYVVPFVTGAVQLKLSQTNMTAIPVVRANPEVNAAFNKLIEPIFAKVRALHDEVSLLAALRDTLLPKLLSGELQASDAERIAARCI